MSVKTPSERFLMTLPQPIHDWLSREAKTLGVTVQDRVRVMLEEEQKRRLNYTDAETEAIKQECYLIGKETYDKLTTERSRLEKINLEKHTSFMIMDNGIILMLPIMEKTFYPFLPSNPNILAPKPTNKLYEFEIRKAAKQMAELENKLLSVCEDGDKLFEALPFTCEVYVKDGKWIGCFRMCLNSERTPSIADAFDATS